MLLRHCLLKKRWCFFLLYKENKTMNQIALEMKKDRTSIWRIRNKALNKIVRSLIGGEKKCLMNLIYLMKRL